MTLKLARDRAATARSQIEAGIDPIAERRKTAGIRTFREAAALVDAEHKKGWRNGKHRKQWLSTLETYCFPHFGDVAVSELDVPAVRDALVQIWLSKPETARRVRQRVLAIIDWSVGKEYRDVPLAIASIDKALPKQRGKVKHRKAVPYTEIPAFMERLREKETLGRLALEGVILTAARSGELRLATWEEIDLKGALWTIPAGRMKAGQVYVVPLSTPAVALFRRMWSYRRGDSNLVFPGMVKGKPLSDMALTKALRDMGMDATVYGFCSSFKDWPAEETTFDHELSMAALARAVKNKTEAAYRRGNLLNKRRTMMQAWARYCKGVKGNIVRLASA